MTKNTIDAIGIGCGSELCGRMDKFRLSFDETSEYYVEDENLGRIAVPGFTHGLKYLHTQPDIYLSMMLRNTSLIKNLPLQPTDVIVATYPKSGTTFFEGDFDV